MQRILIYLVRVCISLIYCSIISVIIKVLTGFDWGASFALAGFIFIVLGALHLSTGGGNLPVMKIGSTNAKSIDSTSIRQYSDVGSNVKDVENQMAMDGIGKSMQRKKKFRVLDIVFYRTGIELILTGVLSIVIGLSQYSAYFI